MANESCDCSKEKIHNEINFHYANSNGGCSGGVNHSDVMERFNERAEYLRTNISNKIDDVEDYLDERLDVLLNNTVILQRNFNILQRNFNYSQGNTTLEISSLKENVTESVNDFHEDFDERFDVLWNSTRIRLYTLERKVDTVLKLVSSTNCCNNTATRLDTIEGKIDSIFALVNATDNSDGQVILCLSNETCAFDQCCLKGECVPNTTEGCA